MFGQSHPVRQRVGSIAVTRMVECWGDDLMKGEHTDFYRAVDAEEGETVVFSWMEYPDKETRDAAHRKME